MVAAAQARDPKAEFISIFDEKIKSAPTSCEKLALKISRKLWIWTGIPVGQANPKKAQRISKISHKIAAVLTCTFTCLEANLPPGQKNPGMESTDSTRV